MATGEMGVVVKVTPKDSELVAGKWTQLAPGSSADLESYNSSRPQGPICPSGLL